MTASAIAPGTTRPRPQRRVAPSTISAASASSAANDSACVTDRPGTHRTLAPGASASRRRASSRTWETSSPVVSAPGRT
jgi:hypothetical protein